METLERKNAGLKPHITNREYHKYTMRINRCKNRIMSAKVKDQKYDADKKLYLESIKARRKLRSLLPNPSYCKIRYVRYADD